MKLKKTIVIKPTLNCNLRCKYCYELNRDEHLQLNSKKEEIDICKMIERFANLFEESEILWMLHGGEPLLMKKEAFKRICETIKKVNLNLNVNYKIALQTNGTLIDDEWVNIFKEYIELFSERTISVSIDGDKEINDETRIDSYGKSTYEIVKNNIERIRTVGLDVTTISVIGEHNLKNVKKIYNEIKEIGPNFSKFIPCYNMDENGEREKYGIKPREYASAMCEMFDLWLKDMANLKVDEIPMALDPVVTIIASITNSFITWCEYSKNKCDNFLTVFPNGEMWLCDSFQQDIHREEGFLGNYLTLSDQEIRNKLMKPCDSCSIEKLKEKLSKECRKCSINDVCNGGCLPYRDSIKNKSEEMYYEYCEGKRILIGYIREAIDNAMSKSKNNI